MVKGGWQAIRRTNRLAAVLALVLSGTVFWAVLTLPADPVQVGCGVVGLVLALIFAAWVFAERPVIPLAKSRPADGLCSRDADVWDDNIPWTDDHRTP